MLPIDGVFCCRIDGAYQEQCIAVRLWMRTLSMRPTEALRAAAQSLLGIPSILRAASSAHRADTTKIDQWTLRAAPGTHAALLSINAARVGKRCSPKATASPDTTNGLDVLGSV